MLAMVISIYITRTASTRLSWLSITTPLLTAMLLWFYHTKVTAPSHGMAIIILPLTTGWLWWRRRETGKPALSDPIFAVMQIAYGLLYILMTRLQAN